MGPIPYQPMAPSWWPLPIREGDSKEAMDVKGRDAAAILAEGGDGGPSEGGVAMRILQKTDF